MSKNPKDDTSFFQKVSQMGHAALDAQIFKARNSITMNAQKEEEDFHYAKAVTEEPNYSIHTSGWKEKPTRLQNSHLKQMSIKNSIATAIIQTRQNQVAAHSKFVESEQETGAMIVLKDEKRLIEEMKKQLREEQKMAKSDENIDEIDQNDDAIDQEQQVEDRQKEDDDVEEIDWELERKARDMVRKKYQKEMRAVQEYVENCGKLENRPFDKEKWNFDSALRAMVRDSLTYDLYAVETVPDRAGKPHHWFPVDGGTVRYASVDLKKYKEIAENFVQLDLLYPEKEVKQVESKKIVELKDEYLAADKYKWVQVIRGRIERAYTPDELKVGIRNLTTDIFNNGYGLGELELAVSLITGHLNAEYYNQSYFTQGFSAKGILHIKAALNRRKVETVRQQWQHMIRGSRNSFQTPIFAGVNDVQWIPLTQNHDDIGFEGWMRYLIKVMCAIFQIDPQEIGIGFKEEGSGGGGMAGDNTKEKLAHSKDKGLIPLLRHFENFINNNVIAPFDDRFCIMFTGASSEDKEQALERQEREVKFKKTVNEIREEDGLPPLPGMDNVILGPDAMTWYAQFSPEAQELNQKNMEMAAAQGDPNAPPGEEDDGLDEINSPDGIEGNIFDTDPDPDVDNVEKSLRKSSKPKKLKIEYYQIG